MAQKGRPKGARNTVPEARMFVQRVERMLKNGGFDESLERLACRLLTHPAHEAMETKFFADKGYVKDTRDVINWSARLKATEIAAQVWRTLMQYKHGMPTQTLSGKDGEPIQIQLITNAEFPKA